MEPQILDKKFHSGEIYFSMTAQSNISQNAWEKNSEDFHVFGSLSNDIRGRKSKDEDELKNYLQEYFDSKSQEFYAKGIHDLPRRWREIILANEEYVSW